jgi:aminoglycoside phosphotransferase (APT) family kinase protein
MNALTAATKVTNRNVYRYLRLVAPDLKFDELEIIYRRGGESVTFAYGKDRILKVPRNQEKRRNILSEVRILAHLAERDIPVALPKPLAAHDEGLYAIFERIEGKSLTHDTLDSFEPEARERFARRIGEFLAFLHTHEFPADLLAALQIGDDTIRKHHERARRKIMSIQEYAKEPFDTSSWEEQLKGYESLESIPTLAHADMDLDHIFHIPSDPRGFGVIDFADAQLADPYIDLAELSVPAETLELILSHYHTNDPTIRKKIEFGHLCRDIHRQYKAVKKSGK